MNSIFTGISTEELIGYKASGDNSIELTNELLLRGSFEIKSRNAKPTKLNHDALTRIDRIRVGAFGDRIFVK